MNNKLITLKSIFNHYLNNLPNILSDSAQKFDQMVNYFFPDILEQFLSNEQFMIYPLTNK